MRNKCRRWATVGLAVLMGVTVFTGCGKEKENKSGLDPEAVVMTIGNDEITMQEAYFLAKWQQAEYSTMGTTYFGEDWYDQDMFGEGQTFQQSIKEQVLTQLERMYVMKAHMDEYGVSLTDEEKDSIQEVTDNFIKGNDDDALDAMMADEELVKRVMTNYVCYNKMYNALVQDVDTSVSDEEARQKTYSYIYQSFTTTDDDGNTKDMTAAEQQNYYSKFEQIAAAAKESGDFDQTATDAGYSTASHSFGITDDDSFSDINSIADKMAVNDVSDVIVVDGGLFLIKMDSVNDEEATENARQNIANTKLNNAFEEKYEAMKGDIEREVDEDLWAKVTFEEPLAKVEQ